MFTVPHRSILHLVHVRGEQPEKEMSYFDPVSVNMHKWQKLELTVVNGQLFIKKLTKAHEAVIIPLIL